MKGVRFGSYHSFDDFALILSQKIIGTPSPKTETIDIPGGDGVLDLTEFTGEVKYNNRELSFEFTTKVPQAEFMALFSRVQNALHGQKMNIILDEDAGWYYVGRITVSEWKTDRNIGLLTIDCDCEPYKYRTEETVVAKVMGGGTSTVTLVNGRKKVIPVITTDAETTVSFGTFMGVFSPGTFTIPELQLVEGENAVKVRGTGNVSFSYREGVL